MSLIRMRIVVVLAVIGAAVGGIAVDALASTRVAGTAGYDPRALHALPATTATGPAVPDLRGVVLDGTLGLSTSLEPTLKWGTAQATFRVTDLAGDLVWSGSGAGQARVGAGKLREGGVYLWNATDSAGTAAPEHMFRVDTQGSGVQTLAAYSGVNVASVTGEAIFGFDAFAASLQYRPSNSTAQFHSAGVPAAWRLTTNADAPWQHLRRVSANAIELQNASGVTVPFRQTSPGAWMATWGAGQNWPSGEYATLSQSVTSGAASGDFQITDRSGTVVAFPDTPVGQTSRPTASWSAKDPKPVAHYDATGRLVSLTDPITGHVVTLHYGGGTCYAPHAGTGLKSAPAGYLCSVSRWDGRRADIFYREHDVAGAGPLAGPQIARIVSDAQASGQQLQQLDLGYDAAGRLATIRSTTANAAIAAGVLSAAGITAATPANPNVLTEITYDSRGRVASITRPAALVAGSATIPARSARAYAYGASEGTFTVTEPGTTGALGTTVSNPADFLISSNTDSLGLKSTTTWDASRQLPLTETLPGGFVTKYEYDASGRIKTKIGPTTAPASAAAPRTTETYDTHTTTTGRAPTTGLLATYWAGASMQGAPAGADVGPATNGVTPTTLQYNWTAIAANHPFAARLEGTIMVPPGGISQITAGSATQLWINGVSCPGACPPSLNLAEHKAGAMLQIRIDVASSASGIAAVHVAWTPTGKASTSIPSTALHPMLPNPTATAVRDQISSGSTVTELTSDVAYSASDPSEIVSARSASHAVSTRQYEAWAPQSGHYTRATGATNAGGHHWTTTYYAKGEAPAVACPGTAADQRGYVKTHTTSGGLTTTNAYDISGNLVGTQDNGGAKTCTAYDAVGEVISVTTTGAGDAASTVTTHYESIADHNPLLARTTYPGTTYGATTTAIDLLGRAIGATDTWGTTTTITYDKDDQPVSAVVTTAGGESTTLTTTYNRDGSIHTISRDGTVLSTSAYQSSTGRLTGVTYQNGATVALGYDANGNASTRTLTIGGQTITEKASLAPSGRTLGYTVTAPETNATWAYTYSKDSRLTEATLTGTVPVGVNVGTWTYALDAAGQRTSVTSPYTAAGGYTYTYNAAGAITSTSDPRFAAGFAYDGEGRATKAGPLALAYGATGGAANITDGTVSIDNEYLPDGTQISQSITSGTTLTSARYSLGSLILDAAGKISSQTLDLPGGVSVQLPAPAVATAATWRYADLSGSIAWQAQDGAAPTTTQLYDPDGNRLSGPPLSTDARTPNPTFEGANTAALSIAVSAMGARDYVPALGVFLQADPVPDSGLTAYNYADSDPVNMADTSGNAAFFSGQWWKENWIGITVAIVTTVVVTVATAGTASTAAVGFWAGALKGAVIGAVSGALEDAVVQGIELAAGTRQSFDVAQLGVAAGFGALLGGAIGGGAGYKLSRFGSKYGTPYGAEISAHNAMLKAEGGSVWQRIGNRFGFDRQFRSKPPASTVTWSELMGNPADDVVMIRASSTPRATQRASAQTYRQSSGLVSSQHSSLDSGGRANSDWGRAWLQIVER